MWALLVADIPQSVKCETGCGAGNMDCGVEAKCTTRDSKAECVCPGALVFDATAKQWRGAWVQESGGSWGVGAGEWGLLGRGCRRVEPPGAWVRESGGSWGVGARALRQSMGRALQCVCLARVSKVPPPSCATIVCPTNFTCNATADPPCTCDEGFEMINGQCVGEFPPSRLLPSLLLSLPLLALSLLTVFLLSISLLSCFLLSLFYLSLFLLSFHLAFFLLSISLLIFETAASPPTPPSPPPTPHSSSRGKEEAGQRVVLCWRGSLLAGFSAGGVLCWQGSLLAGFSAGGVLCWGGSLLARFSAGGVLYWRGSLLAGFLAGGVLCWRLVLVPGAGV
ncbi:unnamed protein product [Closterium sp. NIES-64]|nr:unnamed protein product [Closterium sp. NIES-64]